MSNAHLNLLKKLLTMSHWVVNKEFNNHSEHDLEWHISRPNGDTPLELSFSQGHGGLYGDIALDEIDHAIACEVKGYPDINYLYFASKFQGKFQIDIIDFVTCINEIDKIP